LAKRRIHEIKNSFKNDDHSSEWIRISVDSNNHEKPAIIEGASKDLDATPITALHKQIAGSSHDMELSLGAKT
jgi:hypothetical protein